MPRKKRGRKKRLKKPQKALLVGKKKFDMTWRSLLAYIILFIICMVLYGISRNPFLDALFGILAVIFGVLAIAFLIAFLVFLFSRFVKK